MSDPGAYTTWLRVLSAEAGTKPLSAVDAEHLGHVADGIERLRDALEKIYRGWPCGTTRDMQRVAGEALGQS